VDRHQIALWTFLALVALNAPACTPRVRSTTLPAHQSVSSLWEQPSDLASRDLFNGPWGPQYAPDPKAIYTFVRPKQGGVNPGVVVTDPLGRTWHVKQAPGGNRGDEGPVEVMLSRVLSAIGYHQPPVYFLPSFTMRDASGTHLTPGGRFRPDLPSLKDRGEWSWQSNPFVNTRPYQGLLVALLMFNGSDLKNSNNTLYEVTRKDHVEYWYVVRDLGLALGDTGRWATKRNNLTLFERQQLFAGVNRGFVDFRFNGAKSELIRRRITPDDVGWTSDLLAGLTDRQWHDAFRAGGYQPEIATRFIRKLVANIAEGQRIGRGQWRNTAQRQ
jgi:hypothetical protein